MMIGNSMMIQQLILFVPIVVLSVGRMCQEKLSSLESRFANWHQNFIFQAPNPIVAEILIFPQRSVFVELWPLNRLQQRAALCWSPPTAFAVYAVHDVGLHAQLWLAKIWLVSLSSWAIAF